MKKWFTVAVLLSLVPVCLSALPLRSVSEGFFENRSHDLSVWGFRNSFIFTPREKPPFFLTPGLTVYPETLMPDLEGGGYVVWADRSYSRLAYKVALPLHRGSYEQEPPEHTISFDITRETALQILTLGVSTFVNTDRFNASLYITSRWTGPASRFGIRATGWVTSTEGPGASAAADWELFTAHPLGWNLGFTAGTYRREDQTELRGADVSGRTALVLPLSRGRVVYQTSVTWNPDFRVQNHSIILDISL